MKKNESEETNMKPWGRSPTPFSENDLKAIKEYLESDKGFVEVATKYGLTREQLRYKVKRYKKEQAEKNEQ